MTANSLLQLSRIDKENVKRKDLIVVSPEMLEVCVNRILTNLQTCLRETLELPSIKLSLTVSAEDMKKLEALNDKSS